MNKPASCRDQFRSIHVFGNSLYISKIYHETPVNGHLPTEHSPQTYTPKCSLAPMVLTSQSTKTRTRGESCLLLG